MTRCNKSEVNLKSSVYNQTGETYFQRLSAYNRMSSHLRRVLLAKSVIDARNDRYIQQRERRSKSANCRRTTSEDFTKNVIDRLALDTSHHPQVKQLSSSIVSRPEVTGEVSVQDVLRMTLNQKFSHGEGCCERCEQETLEDVPSSRRKTRNDLKNYERSKSRSRKTWLSPSTARLPRSPTCNPFECAKQGYKQFDEKKHKCGEHGVYCTTTFECMSSGSSSATRETDSSSHSIQESDAVIKKYLEPSKRRDFAEKEEEAKYAKFVYDITREIVQNGLYKDKELQEVFKKHIRENKDKLNMNKMLYEIYQLKISLNVSDESDMDEELEEQVYARRFSSAYELKPPTPPKVLDENKVIEKLLSYRTSVESRPRTSSPGTKSVVLIDANPDLHVTERDVLLTLMEVDIDPEQAQYICKSLFHKSKETPGEMQSSSLDLADTESLQPQDSSSSSLEAKNSQDNGEGQVKQIEDEELESTDQVSQKDEDTQVEVPVKTPTESRSSYTEPLSVDTKDEVLQTENLEGKKARNGEKMDPKESYSRKGKSSTSNQVDPSAKTEAEKNRRKVHIGAAGKVEKSRSSSHDSNMQVLEKSPGKYRKDQRASGKDAEARKDKAMKTSNLAHGSKSTRSREPANNGPSVVVISPEKEKLNNQKKRNVKLHETSLTQVDYESEEKSIDADEVEEEIEESIGSEAEEVLSPRRESWIESRDVDTDVSETNGYEHSAQDDTIFTETEASNAEKHK